MVGGLKSGVAAGMPLLFDDTLKSSLADWKFQ